MRLLLSRSDSAKNSNSSSSATLLGLTVLTFFFRSVEAQATVPYDPYSLAARCPFSCTNDRNDWAHYQDVQQLDSCNRTVLMELTLYNKVDDPEPQVSIRACAVQSSQSSPSFERRQTFSFTSKPNSSKSSLTLFDVQKQTTNIQILRRIGGSVDTAAVSAAAISLANYIHTDLSKGSTILFAKAKNVIIGAYAGSQIEKESLSSIIHDFPERAVKSNVRQAAAQVCDSKSLSTQILGIILDTTGDLAVVQNALRGWNDAKRLDGLWDEEEIWPESALDMISGIDIDVGPDNNEPEKGLAKRAICSYTQAVAGDGCYALADRCKTTQQKLIEYNGDSKLCNNLVVGQYVCCSPGSLPDFSPQVRADGGCKTYTINSGDVCATIAQKNSMTVDQINARNKNTWGWAGCSYLVLGGVICLSTGFPPMPAPVSNAVCGPQVPGTTKPVDMSDLADLNPCPLNVCCNVWGQCGITKDFCVPSPADTGAPGTAKAGSNGCIASCGMKIVNNNLPPAQFMRLGYFEAWNLDRPCLHMLPRQIDTKYYTHIHFAFASISKTFDVELGKLEDMFTQFKAMKGVKRILSFGGWSFSTEYDTFPIFRTGVTVIQRKRFANNVVSFVVEQGLDGVDFDWEYPGAPDIPGIPPGSKDDGPNYLSFLKLVRAALPQGKTIGIAAPASYWYLKGFPIEEIAKVVDYIVYMTYDLHGQWDYGNRYSTEGCPAGNCLRSHVNRTETENSLVMVTKAGVPANKVVVGMALYGRSFRMSQAGCYGPDCTYYGPESGATPGKCTNTRSYISNFEIREIIASRSDVQQFSDIDGDILVYDGVQWVSWMTRKLYNDRVNWIKNLNFRGTSDWAIDLDADYQVNDESGDGDNGSGPVIISPDVYRKADPVIACDPPCTFVLPPWVLSTKTTIVVPPATVTYEENWSTTITIGKETITTKAASITSTIIEVPPVITTAIDLWNVVWTKNDDDGDDRDDDNDVIWLTSSVTFPPITLTQRTTLGVTRPPITWTYRPGPFPTPQPGKGNPKNPKPPPPGPPKPPPGFPSSVRVTKGPPKPICIPPQICGRPCVINCNPRDSGCFGICGCIGFFCPHGNCVGSGCGGGGGGGDGDGKGENPTSCRRSTTASFCKVDCSVYKYPKTTSTRCGDPSCSRTITACKTTGSTTTTTATISCATSPPYVGLNPKAQVPILGDGGRGGVVIDPGDYTSMRTPAPPRPIEPDEPPTAPRLKEPVDPPAAPDCRPTPKSPIQDSHKNSVRTVAKFFCEQIPRTTREYPVNIEKTINDDPTKAFFGFDDEADDVYDIFVRSVPNCKSNGEYNLHEPVPKQFCADILFDTWAKCNNKGRGGSIAAGCLVYGLWTKY